jgi:hypothetical protein
MFGPSNIDGQPLWLFSGLPCQHILKRLISMLHPLVLAQDDSGIDSEIVAVGYRWELACKLFLVVNVWQIYMRFLAIHPAR